MKITVLGCGNAFSEQNFNQSFLLEEEHEGKTRRLLIDCGYQVQAALAKAGYTARAIDDIYISHQHADHIGCLEWMAFSRYDWVTQPKPQSYKDFNPQFAVPPVLYAEKSLMKDLWNKSLSGGLDSMEGFDATLSTFFETKAVNPSTGFKWQGWQAEIIQQLHVVAKSRFLPAYGIMFSKPGHKTVYFTTDSQHCSPEQVETFYNRADMIFQDCETTPFMSKVHANYIQLAGYDEANSKKLPAEIKAKMKLSHYQDWVSKGQKMVTKGNPFSFYRAPEDAEGFPIMVDFDWDAQAKEDGFDEIIKVGNEYNI